MRIHRVDAFADNYIWILQAPEDARVWVVDPGEPQGVLSQLAAKHWQLAGILVTHHHADHIGGIATLLQHTTCPVYGPRSIASVSHPLTPDTPLELAADIAPIEVIATPGHTADHLSYLQAKRLFCGDTLFAGGCGRLLGGTIKQLFDSLQRLAQLPDDTEIFCAHEYTLANLQFASMLEPDNLMIQQRLASVQAMRAQQQATVPSRMAEERLTNPFLRCHTADVHRSAEQYCGRTLESPLAVMQVVRAWKDHFRGLD